MSKKVYVGGRMSDPASLERVHYWQQRVLSAGHSVVLDWTDLPDNGPDEELSHEASVRVAEAELSALLFADLVILFLEPSLGVSVEAGICIAQGKPLWIVHCPGQASVWWHLPNVREFSEPIFQASVDKWGFNL